MEFETPLFQTEVLLRCYTEFNNNFLKFMYTLNLRMWPYLEIGSLQISS